eukprot:jgi/Bigna1/84287/fgenesh1_pg.128_\
MERKETPQWNTMKKLCEMLTTMVQLVDEKQQQLQQDQKDMQEENAGLKNKLLKLEEELNCIKEHQKNGTMEAQPSLIQRTSRTCASVTTSSRADGPHDRDKHPEAEVQRLAERKHSQSWQVPKSHARNQRKYNRKYKQNVLILELDKTAMLQAGGAIMASGDPCRTVLTGKKQHANEPTSEKQEHVFQRLREMFQEVWCRWASFLLSIVRYPLPSSSITGIKLKLPSVATSWMRAICGVGNLGKFMPSRGQCTEEDATCDACGILKDMDHLLQCPTHSREQIRLRNQMRAIMNRNDDTNRLTKAEKDSRTAARSARQHRSHEDAFKCMKHIVAETNRCNISAVAAALHSYIRMTIEKI